MTFQQITHADDLTLDLDLHAKLMAGAVSTYALEKRCLRKDGALLWSNITVSRERGGGESNSMIAVVEDITERKQMEQRLLQLAHFDVLTSLPNRLLFRDRLRHALAQANRSDWLVAVLFVGLDRFKLINDTYGHGVGDHLLQEVARMLLSFVRESDTASRLGGDEFALILTNLACAQNAVLLAQKLLDAFAQPLMVDGHEISRP